MMGILRILLGVLLFVPFLSFALTPSAAQIEAFKNLSPAEQKALAKQYGIELPAATSPAAMPVTTPEVVTPRVDVSDTEIQTDAASATDKADLKEDKQEMATKQRLVQFGYDLFAGSPTTFAPATDIPVPVDYVVGPGDVVMVQLYGKENATHELIVNREGIIQFPEIGPISVAGQSYQEMKAYLIDTVSRQMIGVKASITMGALRSIRVFVLGEAYRPGSYTVSALSTMTNALFVSGGITKVGSLRNIQLKRKGEVKANLDLYDLLLKGDTTNDQRLLPGDVIFIPAIGETVGVSGEVKRPAIYELDNETNAQQVIELAGGYLPSAFPSESRIERISTKGSRTIVDLDLTTTTGKRTRVRNGDVLQVFSVLDKMEGVVLLSGHVQRPGGFSWKPGLRVTDVVSSYDDLLANPDVKYAIIKREKMPERKISVIQVSLAEALANPRSEFDKELSPRDELIVFGAEESRASILSAITERLKSQSDYLSPAQVVSVQGNVRFSGEYPFHSNMTVEELIDASSGLGRDTDLDYALLVREKLNKGKVDVVQLSPGNKTHRQIKLSPLDQLIVFDLKSSREELIQPVLEKLALQAKEDEELRVVSVSGLVRFPGDYPLVDRMSVQSLIQAAGGFKESAYTMGAEITRSVISDRKTQEFERVAVNLNQSAQQTLKSRDQLYIKKIPNWAERETATISGEVNFPGVYPIYKGDTIVDLIQRAGGISELGDPNAAIFMREDLKRREQQQILKFKAQLEKDLAEMKLEAAQDQTKKVDAESIGGSMLEQLASAKATGRLVIDLPKMLGGEVAASVVLKNMDQLVIPRKSTEVSVVGEVQFPTSHFYESGLDVFDYVDVSGGFTNKSDDDRIYVIRPNGKIISVKNGWFFNRDDEVGPGDTVVVPYDTDAMSPMAYWVSMSQILFQLATTVAALDSVGVFN
ncbi:MAG: SLBB domain-containing protein [Pseudomonadales bacterium]|nr:SLBB domain-containing protein [Pseudomonadales bacterium]